MLTPTRNHHSPALLIFCASNPPVTASDPPPPRKDQWCWRTWLNWMYMNICIVIPEIKHIHIFVWISFAIDYIMHLGFKYLIPSNKIGMDSTIQVIISLRGAFSISIVCKGMHFVLGNPFQFYVALVYLALVVLNLIEGIQKYIPETLPRIVV